LRGIGFHDDFFYHEGRQGHKKIFTTNNANKADVLSSNAANVETFSFLKRRITQKRKRQYLR
jgi:hypothetical protein